MMLYTIIDKGKCILSTNDKKFMRAYLADHKLNKYIVSHNFSLFKDGCRPKDYYEIYIKSKDNFMCTKKTGKIIHLRNPVLISFGDYYKLYTHKAPNKKITGIVWEVLKHEVLYSSE